MLEPIDAMFLLGLLQSAPREAYAEADALFLIDLKDGIEEGRTRVITQADEARLVALARATGIAWVDMWLAR